MKTLHLHYFLFINTNFVILFCLKPVFLLLLLLLLFAIAVDISFVIKFFAAVIVIVVL